MKFAATLLLLSAAAVLTASGLRCPLMEPETVCSIANEGFRYSDGCNGVECMGEGQFTTTMRWCPRPESNKDLRECHSRAVDVYRRLGPFSCSNLRPADICGQAGRAFRYFDGCNQVNCEADGGFTSTLRMCPPANPEGAYCRVIKAAVLIPDKRRRRRR